MFDPSALKSDFGGAAAGYDEHALLQQEVRSHAVALGKAFWPAGSRILDIGSGTGAFASETEALGWDVVGLDAAFGMCASARQKNASSVNGLAEKLPFAAESFDGVFSSLMLQWSAEPVKVFAEVKRVMRPGSRAVLATFIKGTLFELADAFGAADSYPHVSRFPSSSELAEWADSAGLHLQSMEVQQRVEHYPSLMELIRSLKNIGATNKDTSRRRGLLTPRQLAKVKNRYHVVYGQHAEHKGALPASWQMLYMVLQKE